MTLPPQIQALTDDQALAYLQQLDRKSNKTAADYQTIAQLELRLEQPVTAEQAARAAQMGDDPSLAHVTPTVTVPVEITASPGGGLGPLLLGLCALWLYSQT
jgi:hypothetical protein